MPLNYDLDYFIFRLCFKHCHSVTYVMGRAGIREDTIEEGKASEEENVEKAGPFNLGFFSVSFVVILQVERGWKQDSRFFSH